MRPASSVQMLVVQITIVLMILIVITTVRNECGA